MQKVIKYILFATAFTPLIVTRDTIFPFMFGKMIFFRVLVELALILWLILLILRTFRGKKASEHGLSLFKNPIVISVMLFFASVVVSTIFAVNNYRAFWGEAERAEGLFGMLHFILFFLLTIVVFERRDWISYIKLSLVTGAIVAIYGIIQCFNMRDLSFANIFHSRPPSYMGNVAYLATHLFFVFMFAVIVWTNSRPKTFWRYTSALTALIATLTIFMTNTRGATVGLGVGLIVLLTWLAIRGKKAAILKGINARIVSTVLLVILIISCAAFWATRTAPVWQFVPGINRLANIAITDKTDAPTQLRLLNWKLGWEAFKERPIFGWGPENFLTAYLAHYNPDMAIYSKTWFDRAHNKMVDVAVMQGGVGLLLYLGIFGTLLFTLFKKGTGLHLLIAVGICAYFVQNLFFLDQIVSYLTFFVILGFVASECIAEKKQQIVRIPSPKTERFKRFAYPAVAIAIILILIYTLFAYNYTPYIQARAAMVTFRSRKTTPAIEKFQEAFYPYNFAQINIRSIVFNIVYSTRTEIIENPDFAPIEDTIMEAIEEILAHEPYDPRVFLRVATAYNKKANGRPEFYRHEVDLMQQALKLAPKRQELYYHLAFALGAGGNSEGAIAAAREAVSLSPRVAKSHLQLAIMLSPIKKHREEAKRELETALSLDPEVFRKLNQFDMSNVKFLHTVLGIEPTYNQ